MIEFLIIATYVVGGIGTARWAYTAEYTHFARELADKRGDKRIPQRTEVHREMRPVAFWPVLGGTLWPVWVPFAVAYLAVRPLGKVFGPLIVKWWDASINRKLRKAGLS